MKKITFGGTVSLFLVALMLFTVLAACAPAAQSPSAEPSTAEPSQSPATATPEIKTVKIRLGLASWTLPETEAFAELVELFHQSEYSISDGKVFFVEYNINDALSRDPPRYEAVIKTGVDLLFMPSNVMDKAAKNTGRTSGDEMFLPIDTSRITTYDNLLLTEPDPATGFMLPLYAQGLVLAYRSDLVVDPPESMQQLLEWMRLNPGKFSKYRVGLNRDFTMAAVYQFLPGEAKVSSDPKWEAEWEQGKLFLTDLCQYLYARDGKVYLADLNEENLALLSTGEVYMTADYLDAIMATRKKGLLSENVKLSMLPGQFAGETKGIYITADGHASEEEEVSEGVYAFLSFLLTPEAQEIWVKAGRLPVIGLEKMSTETREMYADIDSSKFAFYDIGEDMEAAFQKKVILPFTDLCESITPVS